jgi:hypothetical protein
MTDSTKSEVLKMIERMPDDASLEDIMYALYFRERVEHGLQQVKTGQTISQSEMRKLVAEWLSHAGP